MKPFIENQNPITPSLKSVQNFIVKHNRGCLRVSAIKIKNFKGNENTHTHPIYSLNEQVCKIKAKS